MRHVRVHIGTVLIALVVAAGTVALPPRPLQAHATASSGQSTSNIRNLNAGDKCIGIDLGSNAGDWSCTGNADQQWYWNNNACLPQMPAYCRLQNNQNQCLGVAGGSTTEGAQILGWSCLGSDHPDQYWQPVSCSGSYYNIRNSDGYVVGVAGGSTDNGAPLIQWQYVPGHPDQCWLTPSGYMPIFGPRDGYGIYDSCYVYDPKCLGHLQTFADGGFKEVLNYDSFGGGANAQQVRAYADQALTAAVKVIWAMNNPHFWDGTNLLTFYYNLAPTCGCQDNPGFIRYLVSLVAGHPATWGYYTGDEVTLDQLSQWQVYAAQVQQADPSHPRLFVGGTRSHYYGNPDIGKFAAGAEVLAQDYYPVGADYQPPYTQTDQMARTFQSVATAARRDSGMVLQAVSWQDYYPPAQCNPYPACAPFPSLLQMQQMLKMTIANSSTRLILYYSYFDILRSSDPAGNWANLVATLRTYNQAPLPQTIYDNGLDSPFQDSTAPDASTYLNPCDGSTFVTAPCSYAIALRAQKGFQWQASTPLSLAGYTTLEWDMNLKGQPITDFSVGVLAGGTYYQVGLNAGNITNTFTSGDGWVHVSVLLAGLHPGFLTCGYLCNLNVNGPPITLLELANLSSGDLATVYIDDVTLVP